MSRPKSDRSRQISAKGYTSNSGTVPDAEWEGPVSEVGSRIRAKRQKMGLTLEQVADQAGFGKSYLSRIENGKKVPPLATLMQIASVLKTDASALIASNGSASATWNGVTFVKANEKRPAVLGGSSFGYDYSSTTDTGAKRSLQAYTFTFPEEIDKLVFFQHDGEELMHVISGRVEWQVGQEKYIMEAGDTIHFDSSLPHKGRSLSGHAVALVVIYSPGTADEDLA